MRENTHKKTERDDERESAESAKAKKTDCAKKMRDQSMIRKSIKKFEFKQKQRKAHIVSYSCSTTRNSSLGSDVKKRQRQNWHSASPRAWLIEIKKRRYFLFSCVDLTLRMTPCPLFVSSFQQVVFLCLYAAFFSFAISTLFFVTVAVAFQILFLFPLL